MFFQILFFRILSQLILKSNYGRDFDVLVNLEVLGFDRIEN